MIIDTNVTLSRWPFRRVAGDEPAEMVARLKKWGVTQAWAGSFDGVFHRDLAGANTRLAKDCRTYGQGILVPFGSVNPKLPDWQEDLRRCQEEHKMPGIRVHPNYHGYDLADPLFAELLRSATARKLIVQLAVQMEDERTHHPLMRVPPVDLTPLAGLVEREPRARLVVLNWSALQSVAQLRKLAPVAQIYFDLAMLEGIGGVGRLLQQVPLPRVLFGSHSPLFYFESARLKVQESGLTAEQTEAVCAGNGKSLLSW
jgi:uncharacterized protein